MANFFLHEGTAEILMSYITRYTPGDSGEGLEDWYLLDRPRDNSIALKRAYRVTELFMQASRPFSVFVSVRISNIGKKKTQVERFHLKIFAHLNPVSSLFDVFKDGAKGSFYHWHKIFDCLLSSHTTKVISVLLEKKLVPCFTKYLHESCVAESFVKLLSSPFTPNDRKLITHEVLSKKYLRHILKEKLASKSNFFPRFFSFLHENNSFSKDEKEHFGAREFFLFLIGNLISTNNTAQIASHLFRDDFEFSFVKPLLHAIGNPSFSEEQKLSCSRVIQQCFNKSREEIVQASMYEKVIAHNFLSDYFPVFIKHAAPNVSCLLDALVATDTKSDTNDRSLPFKFQSFFLNLIFLFSGRFSELRLSLLENFTTIVAQDDHYKLITQVSLPLWTLLVKWFFLHP